MPASPAEPVRLFGCYFRLGFLDCLRSTFPVQTACNLPRRQNRRVVRHRICHEPLSKDAEIYQALVLGTRDYVFKNGFKKAVLGLSGGIDSALTATIASDALGAENVVGVLMPSEFSSPGSFTDAEQLAKHLGIETRTISINEVMHLLPLRSGPVSTAPSLR